MSRLADDQYHIPVLLNECIDLLNIRPGFTYVDATLGGGGHTALIVERIKSLSAESKLIATDADDVAISRAQERFKAECTGINPLLQIVASNFSYLPEILQAESVGGILFDLGVSSFQFDYHDRGFSFRQDSPLDMRFTAEGRTAADIVNTYSEQELVALFYKYAEDPSSRRIAKSISLRRNLAPLRSTFDLRDVIVETVPTQHQKKSLARIFQALRIEVNDELNRLQTTLERVIPLLKPSARIVVMSYHSLEDRIVKSSFKEFDSRTNRTLRIITKKPILPTDEEIQSNPRSRSARLRAAERL